MPKVPLTLQAAKAKESDILAKLSKVQQASQSHKQQTRLNQQRLEWTEQARKLAQEARRLDDDIREAANSLGLLPELAEEQEAGDALTKDAWFQVAGVRQLLAQVRLRDVDRLRRAPDQALSLQEVLGSVTAAINSLGAGLTVQASGLEHDCAAARRSLRRDLPGDAVWAASAGERHAAENCCDLSDEEDQLLDRLGGEEEYGDELRRLNHQVTSELAQLEQELTELRRKQRGWDDEAHFRFVCIKKQFQGRSRDLLVDRLCLEFPHLSREQLQAHEAHIDALKYASQRQAAAFRQWRRDRFQLLRRNQGILEQRQRQEEANQARRQDMQEQREKQRALHGKLREERARHSVKREERQRADEEVRRRRENEEAEKDVAHRKRAQAVKELAKEHGERRREQKMQKEEEEAERERVEAEDRHKRMERNAEVVRLRREMDELKQREVLQQRQLAEQERREREHRLQQAVEKLRVEAPRDPERLLKMPARAQAEAYNDPLVCVTRGPHAGFDEKRLMADARYKLSAALQAAGLFGTKAAHEALAAVQAPRPAQQHIVSQVFAGGGYPS
mmetsp:Transcript_80366/g.202217  ORF Transcript_80366/g.202217 Transcript_80366/m.202217 type:complete len:564 (-) Transcript_80366:38-1729(-)